MAGHSISQSSGDDLEVQAQKNSVEHVYDVDAKGGFDRAAAIEAENAEFNMGVLEAVRAYPSASWWAFVMSCTIVSYSSLYEAGEAISNHVIPQIMEAYCVFLMGNFIALPAFANKFGVLDEKTGKHLITTPWQSALQMGGPVGAFIGVFLAGPLTSKIGYRWATISGLMALNGFIFIFYFANSLGVMLASQLLEGIPWGIFIANVRKTRSHAAISDLN